ncbi:hypothetical protein GTR04_0013 [Trichophyton interdigitale]|uniref:Uncharacterized protein n=1 Tax=Trichophyton interdigitale TaxID=101480 RepID=A0A9P5CZX7_9EURO|nr:hypothetical protein GY631_0961 [Trichophyton interdigitale]KAF3900940.1 hypothetical protein GY632_0344 [Trichophyton interdigitale]KAG8212527.1 hypothetical protein GTR04_0013 [Trichophyton interdigitale]
MEQDNLRIPPLVLPAAQQTAAAGSPDEGTEMHTASPATPASPASSSLQPSPLLAPSRAYPSLNNNLYIPHHASIPDPLLFSPSSPSLQHPEDRSYDAEKRSRRHHKHQKSRHERDERHLRNPSFPIEQVAEMPFHLGKKKARAAAAEAEERAKAQEKRELDEKARRDREAKENKEELARRFPFTRTREAVTQASVEELHTRRLEAEAANRDLLDEITEKSGSFSKRIEDTCGNLVADASAIRGTIHSLQRLSNTALAQHREFLYRTTGVMRNAERHVQNFNKFERQLQSIALLEARLKATNAASKKLDARLEVTRQRIQEWDREEDEWQAKISRRLKITCTVIALLILGWIGTKVMDKWYPDYSIFGSKANTTLHGNSPECSVAPLDNAKDVMTPDTATDIATGTLTSTPTTGRARNAHKTPLDLDALEEPFQRIIDEL